MFGFPAERLPSNAMKALVLTCHSHNVSGPEYARNDHVALASALRRLCEDTELRSRLTACARQSAERFNVQHHVQGIQKLYEGILDRQRRVA